jgi:hypothetical protein
MLSHSTQAFADAAVFYYGELQDRQDAGEGRFEPVLGMGINHILQLRSATPNGSKYTSSAAQEVSFVRSWEGMVFGVGQRGRC